MSWIYPRIVTIRRRPQVTGFGEQDYQGPQKATETNVIGAVNVPASIQEHRTAQDPLAKLPADATGRNDWAIFLPTVPLGTIQQNDIVVDDLGIRYNVTMPYWNGFNYKLICETLLN